MLGPFVMLEITLRNNTLWTLGSNKTLEAPLRVKFPPNEAHDCESACILDTVS